MHIESFFHPIRNSSGFPHGPDGLIDCAAPPCINRAEAAAAPAHATPRRIQRVWKFGPDLFVGGEKGSKDELAETFIDCPVWRNCPTCLSGGRIPVAPS